MVPLVCPICICCVVLCVTYHKMSCGTPSEPCLIMTCLFVFQAVNCKGQHSISYTLSRNQTVVVEYSHDNDTDMFQVKYPGSRLDYTIYVEGGNHMCHPRTLSFIISGDQKAYIQYTFPYFLK